MSDNTMARKPLITLKSIKHTAWTSEETHCYQATLYVDGEKWGNVGNGGHGGPDHFHPVHGHTYSDIADLDKRIAATYPAHAHGDESLEGLCCGLVNAWLTERDFDRAMKRAALFVKPGSKDVFEFKQKGRKAADILPAARAKFPDYRFLADMPRAEAIAAYTGDWEALAR
jgi:hypothetical protein